MSKLDQLVIDKQSKSPVYRQICNGIMGLVRGGGLKVGDQLPAERDLAERLGVARGTISKAYETLVHSGVIEVIQGSGSFISSKQDVVEGERKGQAIRILENAIEELLALRFSSQEISTFCQILLSRYEDGDGNVRIVAIDCNTESLALFEKQFFYIKNFHLTKVLLDDYLGGDRSSFSMYDLILTTTVHHREVIAAAPELKDRIIPCSLTPAQQTIMDLAQIPADASIGVVCETTRFYEIVAKHLVEMQIPSESVSYCNEKSSNEELRRFLADKRVIICKPYSFSGQNSLMASYGEFLARGGRLIYFNYQIDRGTLHQIEDRIRENIRSKNLKE